MARNSGGLALLALTVTLCLVTWGSAACVVMWGRPHVAAVRTLGGIRRITGAELPASATIAESGYQAGPVPQLLAVFRVPTTTLEHFAAARGAGGLHDGLYIWQSRTNGFDLHRLEAWCPEAVRHGVSWDEECQGGDGHRACFTGYLASFDRNDAGLLYLYWVADW